MLVKGSLKYLMGLIALVAGVAIGYAVGKTPAAPTVKVGFVKHRLGWPHGAKSPYFTETPNAPALFRGQPGGSKSPYFTETPNATTLFRGVSGTLGTKGRQDRWPHGAQSPITAEIIMPDNAPAQYYREGGNLGAKSPYFTETPNAPALFRGSAFRGGQWPNKGDIPAPPGIEIF